MVWLRRKISVCKRKIFPQMIPAVSSEIWKIKINAPRNAERFFVRMESVYQICDCYCA